MPSVIARIARAVPADQTWEIRLARTAVSRLAPGFNRKLRQSLICDLLGRLATERKQRAAQNLNHWEEHAPTRITALAEQLLAERGEKTAAYLTANWDRLNDLGWRVTRDVDLADQAVTRTAWELWEGHTEEDVCYRALKMNARNLLRDRSTDLRRAMSVEGLQTAAAARGEDLDLPSHRLEDQDPLEILLAREAQQETNDELEHAIHSVGFRENRWVMRKKWWKASGLADLQKQLPGTDFGGSRE